ncbi:MAG: hypothetical protein ABFS35_15110 [Bacteroidota bacterium]
MLKLILLIFFFSVIINAQTFEGAIQYENLYHEHIVISEVFIKDNKCKTQLNVDGIPLSTYSLSLGSVWFCISGLKETIKKSKHKIVKGNIKLMKNKKKELILGYTCTLYKEKRDTPYGKDIMIYYIADSLKANNQNSSLTVREGRVVLKSIQKTEQGIYENEAIEIKKMKLDDKCSLRNNLYIQTCSFVLFLLKKTL